MVCGLKSSDCGLDQTGVILQRWVYILSFPPTPSIQSLDPRTHWSSTSLLTSKWKEVSLDLDGFLVIPRNRSSQNPCFSCSLESRGKSLALGKRISESACVLRLPEEVAEKEGNTFLV